MIRPRSMSGGDVPVSRRVAALASSAAPAETTDEVVLAVSGAEGEERPFDPESVRVVGRLVLAGIAMRLDLSVSVIERLQLALDELLRRQAHDGLATVVFACSEEELTFRVGPLVIPLPERRRLERLLTVSVDAAAWDDSPRGAWVSARMARPWSNQTRR